MKNIKEFFTPRPNYNFVFLCFTLCACCTVFLNTPASAEPIEDKTSQFDDIFSESISENSTADTSLADKIRAQRAALDAADALNNAKDQAQRALSGGANACDSGLRTCMKKKCGDDFSKCAGDGDTIWGDKMDSCRRDLPCTGHEYQLLSAEIKADRDINAQLSLYNSIIDCGNKYNDCIVTQCGTTFTKCLGKSAGDKAISACAKIAKSCTEQDSGLSARAMETFGNLRGNAEIMVKRDEERLYELRNKMSETCNRLGAAFDERTLDCVYTVNFYAGEDNTLYASKKRYAGSTFDCTPNWFGIDVTTFMENAMRLTREQTSASSAMLGSGLGMAAGAITSGAIDRATDTHKAKKALNEAEKEAGVDKKSQRKAEREKKKAEKEQKKKDNTNAAPENNSSTGGGRSTTSNPAGKNNPAFSEAMKGITYTSTKTSTNTNNENSQKGATKTIDKPTTPLDQVAEMSQMSSSLDVLKTMSINDK